MAGSQALVVTDRRGYLGGTDIASIFGVSPWKTALDVWEEKTSPILITPPVDEKRERLLRRGKRLEPWVMEMIEEETGIFIRTRNRRYTDPEFPWMQCEVDFEFPGEGEFAGEDCNGDIKTVSPFAVREWGEQGTDEIPLHYALQFFWGLMITGRALCLVGVLIGADDLRVYRVKRDDELIAEIRKRAIHFWEQYVLRKIAPPPQTISDTNKLLNKLGGFLVPGEEGIWNKVAAFKKAKEEEKAAKAKRDSIELEIKTFLTVQSEIAGLEATPRCFTLLGPDGKRSVLTCNLQHRASYTVAATDFYVMRT